MTTTLEQNIVTELGLNVLDEKAQFEFAGQVGEVILAAALTRLVASLSEEQVVSLEYFLDETQSAEDLLHHLLTHHKEFETILGEEIAALKEGATSVVAQIE